MSSGCSTGAAGAAASVFTGDAVAPASGAVAGRYSQVPGRMRWRPVMRACRVALSPRFQARLLRLSLPAVSPRRRSVCRGSGPGDIRDYAGFQGIHLGRFAQLFKACRLQRIPQRDFEVVTGNQADGFLLENVAARQLDDTAFEVAGHHQGCQHLLIALLASGVAMVMRSPWSTNAFSPFSE